MNILFLITRRQTRGAETFAVQLAGELAQRGHRLFVASLYAPTETPLAVSPELNPSDLSDARPRAVPHPAILKNIARLVWEEKIDIVQANASDNLKYAVLSRVLHRWKAPIVYRNASIMSAWVRGNWHRKLYARLLDTAEAIASVSWKSKTDITENFGIRAEKVHRLGIAVELPAGVDHALARIKVERAMGQSLPDTTRLIFHIGAFTPEKNHRGLISIFARIRATYPGNVKLVSIGNGPLMEELRQNHDAEDIVWLGYRNDVPELLPAADLLLLPSLIEGTPGVVLEAGANGVVPLAYRVGAVDECYPESLEDELTVELNDEKGMAMKAVEYLKSPDLCTALATELHDFVVENYSLREVGAQFESLYKRLLSSANQGSN